MPEISKENIINKINNLADGVTSKMYSDFSLVDWRPILAKECQVYVYNDAYLAKRFDQINFNFCTKDTAKEILIDNLYALLRFKYFPKSTDEIEERIAEIVKSFTANLKTVLIKVGFDADTENEYVKFLPDGCVAFRNGVYNFRENNWLFKYNKINVPKLSTHVYLYDTSYIIRWYFNLNFEPLDVNINETKFEDFLALLKELDKEQKNYCYELVYNMSHDIEHKFSIEKCKHLVEILGYLCLESFSQHFELFVGTGQNGKNSLFDGCFSARVIPQPASIDINSIEEDKFITGALENKAHNIYLETKEEIKSSSTVLKNITGSPLQTIEHKGEDRLSGYINCKHVFSCNDQDKIKFADNTTGFKRRINIYETYFRWDAKKRFMLYGDYYDTTFSEDLNELKSDISNTVIFIYLAMYGIMLGTENYTHSFRFTKNDWRLEYSDIDFDLKETIDSITPAKLYSWLSKPIHREQGKTMFYDLNRQCLYLSPTLKEYGINNYDEFINNFLTDKDDIFLQYFVEHDIYMSVRHLQDFLNLTDKPSRQFTADFKKLYNLTNFVNLTANKPYVKITFRNNRLKIIG